MDKDKNPKVQFSPQISNFQWNLFLFLLLRFHWFVQWEPSKLELVNDEMVDRYFSKVNEEGWEDLKLPPRLGPGIKLGSKL